MSSWRQRDNGARPGHQASWHAKLLQAAWPPGGTMDRTHVPQGWPTGRTLAVSISVMLEGWAEPDAPGIGPMGNPLKPGVVDLQARSWAEYGPKIGGWRVLRPLHRGGVPGGFLNTG